MRHPTDGTLRRLLDEPAGVADADREHVAGCPRACPGWPPPRQDAALAGAALDVELAVDVDAAWQRLSHAVAAGERGRRPRPQSARSLAGRRCAARWSPALGVVAVLLGAGAAAAADWLQIFRTEQIAPVTITQADLVELPDLSAYGDLEVTEEPDVREVADAAAAEAGHRALGPAGERAAPRRHGRARAPGRRPGERGVHVLGREGGADRRGRPARRCRRRPRGSTAASSGWPPARARRGLVGGAAACRP